MRTPVWWWTHRRKPMTTESAYLTALRYLQAGRIPTCVAGTLNGAPAIFAHGCKPKTLKDVELMIHPNPQVRVAFLVGVCMGVRQRAKAKGLVMA
jgi:hypothetical protein